MNKTAAIILGIILVVAIAGGSFYGGMVYGKSQAQADLTARRAAFQNGGATNGQAGQAGAFAGRAQGANAQGGMLMGAIKEIGAGMLILTDSNGKDTQVKVTDTTLIEKNASVKLADLTAGETLLVSGSTGPDGTVTARSVQVAPQGRFGPGDPNQQNSPVGAGPGRGEVSLPGAPTPSK